MKRLRSGFRSPLFGTIAIAVVLLLGISIWLLTDSRTSRSDALRTGGLAGASVVALYALWLNDRRRRVEEARQEIERRRHDLETNRISDERFARSVELLGNDADQVRVGAMHALAGLARSRAGYTQTVLDVLCAYLRRPFTHPRFGKTPNPEDPEAERELQVRLTAQRLIHDLLPPHDDTGRPSYDLDLTGAALEYLDLSGRRMGSVILRYTYLHSSTNLSGCVFTGPVWFTAATTGTGRLSGRFRCSGTTFRERAWFSGTTFNSLADFTGTAFEAEANFKDATFHGEARFAEATFGDAFTLRGTTFHDDVEPPEGWLAEEQRDETTKLRRA
ncbi:pentapeptide repeat-containing protein [Prauserella flavalba]|uniref:Pentapeptide repeat protein n=1 Tax=Prauserella flavalba TaxID=1477506 RepID=A0A318M688_9PSEU|nr:pentapeptide repeat-containing protein [Prauserella flavalba]PXY38306.1 hypothetical protein BA062_00655 [Prauserella flavalba]